MGDDVLIDVLLRAADAAPEQEIVHLSGDGAQRPVTFRELRDQALSTAASLRERGLPPGAPVIVRTDDDHDFLVLFWAAVAAGVVPVPLPAEQGRLRAVAHQLGDPPVLGSADVRADGNAGKVHRASADDVAFLQFSSGSTGAPKGVRLTHANVLANLDQAGQAGAVAPDDIILTWMPYFHDMGLIGTHLAPMAHGLAQVRIPPMTFAKNPALWFEAAARHRATVLSAANFALAHAVRRVSDDVLAALDLSAVRLVLVGAEPIAPVIWRSFIAKTEPAGLNPVALQPVYGLAEATLAVTFPPLGELAEPLMLDRVALSHGHARPADAGDDAVELMDVGAPVPGCAVRIVDDARAVVDDSQIGHIEVDGPNVARGYHDDPQAFADGWLRTGDLGFLRDGRLCVTGRAKDVLFVNGRTFHAADLEEAAAPGGESVVVGSTDPATGGERIIVFARKNADHTAMAARVAQVTGHDDVRVLGVPARAIPRTTSGKVRRHELRARYEAGAFVDVPEHRPSPSGRGHTTPTAVEQAVREIWAEVLGVDARHIGAHERFLAIGGSSLKAMDVLAKLEERFGTTVPPSALRECDTVSALADHIMRHRSDTVRTTAHPTTGDTAAVIGVACRFPGADSPEEFWAQLVGGVDSVTEIPTTRWLDEPGWGSFLDDPALFDRDAFGITEEEARLIDPHARMLLELAHEALERAGYAGPRRAGLRIGVFAAVGESGYPELLRASGHDRDTAALVGNLRNLVAARVSQALDLTGPAVAIDTACSSALVALHLARRSLADGECDIAVVGGVNLNLTPTAYRLLGAAQALSPTGRCRTFSDAADGFVPGEGGAALVLAPATSARRRGDTLLALVRGSAVNNDGSSLSLLAPNPLRQREVIADAYRAAGVDPAVVSYVECHGTGTAIGDSVEVQSLAHTFTPRPGDRPLRLGSVKTNLGHLLNAAAMPSLVKVVLALHHGQLPPSLHHEPPSSRCDLAAKGFAMVTEPVDWPEPRIAGVNAFGFGGTNAHAILEAAPAVPDEPRAREAESPSLLTLSAHTALALRAAALDLAAYVRANPHVAEADVCATASTARDDGRYRLAVVVDGDLADRLSSAEITEVARSPRVAFTFPDQGVTTRDLAVAGRLWQRGARLDRTAMDAGTRRVPLPTYPFQRKRFWVTDEQLRLEKLVWRESPMPSGTGTAKLLHASDPLETLRHALADPAPLVVVTEDAYSWTEQARPEQALIAGLLRALPDEYSDRALRIVDLSTVDDTTARQAAIATELAAPPQRGAAELVAWREGKRLTPHRVPASPTSPSPLRPDGTYLITGGSGGLGQELARALAATGATVVLTGRSAAPGDLVDYRRCDVTDPDEVDELVRGLPRLDGVFHAAGVLRPVPLRSTSDSDLAALLGPKVTGSRLLADSLARHGHRDAFVVLVSSAASVVPGLAGTLGPYAAANAYLDAFAAQQRAAGRRFVAVNLSAVTGTGMAAGIDWSRALAAAGIGPLSPAEAIAGLQAALRIDAAQVVVTGPVSTPPVPARTPALTAAAPSVRALLANALERPAESIGDDEPFLAMGLDSLTAVDLVKQLEEQLGRPLSHTLFFEAQTLRELTALLAPATRAFPLTDVQRAFVTTGRLYRDVAAYAYVRQTIAGALDSALLQRALTTLAARHPMLRVRLTTDAQQITEAGVVLEVVRLREPIGELEERLCNEPTDLTRSAPLRAVLAQEDDRAHLVLVAHHAAVDGYSLHLLCRELWLTYAAQSSGREPSLGPAPAEFRACVRTADPVDVTWWHDQLAAFPTDLTLPYDGDPDAPPAPPYAAHRVRLDAAATTALRARAAAQGVSLFHLLLAAYARCLAAWSGQQRVAVNVARSGRELRLPGITGTVGPLADTLPVACDVELDEDIGALARRLRDTWLTCEQHASLSSLDIARLLVPAPGERPRTPSPAGFSFAQFAVPATPDGCPLDITATAAGTASAATRLSLVGWEFDGALHFSWNAPTSLFRRDTIARLAEEFVAGLATPVGEHQPTPGVVARIRQQCARTPAAFAVADSLTYGELDRRSDAVAARLHAAGVNPGDHVGLLTMPGTDTVVALVGILKAGAAWVPLDAEHPPARLRDQVDRAGVRLTVRHAATAQAATALGTATIDPFSGPVPPVPPVAAHPDATAYVIFTSGSTGRPKGVPVTHAALVNYLDWAIDTFAYRADDRLTATSSICFDASVRQLLAPLLVGATIVPVPREHTRDPDLLLTALEHGRVTVWSSVPTLWERLLLASERRPAPPDLTALRWVHVGGEALSAAHVRRWFDLFDTGHRITNLYGPTETTINATCHVIDRRPADDLGTLPIGRPAAGAVLRIEDDELLISGPGLTAGYLGEPELTAAVFVQRDGRRFYRSGDRVRVNADGDYEFLGRIDGQLKIRGHRVEPGEVEVALQRHPAVERAVVVPVNEAEHLRLVAHVQPRGPVTADELRAHAATLLPHHMVPARFELTDLPVTAVGKVDRARLTLATTTERRLAEVWARLLGLPAVARDADFFTLGGDSILALRMFDELADLPALPRPTAIYRHRTIAALAAVIDATTPAATPPVQDETATFPLTPAQRGFLLADTLAPGTSSWLACLRLRGELDRAALQKAVDLLVERHLMLRTTFPSGARPPVHQELPRTLRIPIEFAILTTESELTERIAAERTRRLEPWSWPLLRLTLLRTATDDHTLLVHAHHLIGDGWSAALLTRELLTVHERLRRGEPTALPPLRCTFRDYVHMLQQQDARTIDLTDYRPPSWPAEHTPAQTRDFVVAPQQLAELRRRAAAHGTAAHAPVLAAYHRAIAAATGQDDLVIGVATTGRDLPLPGLADVFGPCVAAVPVRLRSNDLTAVAATAASALEHGTTVGSPLSAQFFFTYLDFDQPETTGLRAEWSDTTYLDAPPAGVALFLAARVAPQGLVVNLRAPAGAVSHAMFTAVADELHRELTSSQTLDAAIVGYLPVPENLGDLTAGMNREQIRATLFPDGKPRLLEVVQTPIGVSGFVCLPQFADELADPAAEAAQAADLATQLGARSVSLAGNLPARTGYGFAVARHTTARLTTGHAVTAVSVALTALAALDTARRAWADTRVAFVGLGSIGHSALQLLLADGPPQSLVLCDVPGVQLDVSAELCTATPYAPDLVYTADLIVAAVGSPVHVLDVDRLRPGTLVVDDSFPHCLDTGRALARMRTAADVLVCGGGLLSCGPSTRTPAGDLPPLAATVHAARQVIADTMASCQLESLLCAADPTLPPVQGLVDPALGRVYRDALRRFGITAAPLHLLHHQLPLRRDADQGT